MSTDKKNEVNSFWLDQDLTKNYTLGWYAYGFSINTSIHPEQFDKVKKAILSALNDTVEDSKKKELESLLEYYQAEFNANQDKVYTQAEVDAIRADEFAKGYYSAKEQVTDCLNLNSNDTGKELFTTLDGVKIFRGDTYFPVDDNFNILFTTNAQQEYKDAGWLRAFSTYDAAQYWVSENKPKPEQPTNDNAFVWDDEIRKEFELFVELKCGETNTPCPSLWLIERWKQDFKQSKQSAPEPSALPTKEWEIVSYIGKSTKFIYTLVNDEWCPTGNGYVPFQNNKEGIENSGTEIHSVRRLLPDMEVFSCKDNTNKGVIESFVIITEENRQTAVTAHLDKRENIGKIAVKVSGSLGAAHPNQLLEDLEKLPPTPTQPVVEDKPVLFTTEDNQPVYMGETYWKVTILDQCWKANETVMREELANPPSYFKYFSTKEAAEQYILENKPCLSLNDVFQCSSWYAGNGVNQQNKFFKADLIKAVKQKLNK